VPAALRGRVSGVMTAAMFAASPLGMLLAGLALEDLGLRATLLCATGGYLAICILVARAAALRDLGSLPRPSGGLPTTA